MSARSHKYLEEWNYAGCYANCDGVKLVKDAFSVQPGLTRTVSRVALGDVRQHLDEDGVHCERLSDGQCEIARLLTRRALEGQAIASILEGL